jgi:membrane-bound lytic murein transglycosylase B
MIKNIILFLVINVVIAFPLFSKESSKQSSFEVTDYVKQFASEMEKKYGFKQAEIIEQLKTIKVRQDIIEKISKPAESMDWYRYRKIFIQDKRIQEGVEFWKKHQTSLKKAEEIYGVSPEIIVAIIGVETFYGKIQGNYPVIEALYTLGFHYPKRAKFFRQELAEFFILAKEQGWQYSSIKGSYAGAMGMGQFISSSYRNYAVDFNQDGKINLFTDTVDMIGSVANYFKKHHWRKHGFVAEKIKLNQSQEALIQTSLKLKYSLDKLKAQGIDTSSLDKRSELAGLFNFKLADNQSENWLVGDNFYSITRYNHSKLYALAVFELSQLIKSKIEAERLNQ